MNDLTIFIISTGEESLDECMDAVEKQRIYSNIKPKIEFIKDIYPVSEAFNEMHRRCKTSYFVQVDADIILNDDAINTLYQAIKKSNFLVYSTYGQLYEEGFGPGGSVRCWKKEIFKVFKFRDTRTTDRDFYRRAMLLGLHRKDVKKILGVHKPRQSDFLDYWKTKGDVEKWQYLRRPFKRYAADLYRNLIKEPHKNRYKILGFLMGITTSKERIKRSKNTMLEQRRINSVFSFLKKSFKDFVLPEHTDFAALSGIAARSYLNYLAGEKRVLAKNILGSVFERDFEKEEFEHLFKIVNS